MEQKVNCSGEKQMNELLKWLLKCWIIRFFFESFEDFFMPFSYTWKARECWNGNNTDVYRLEVDSPRERRWHAYNRLSSWILWNGWRGRWELVWSYFPSCLFSLISLVICYSINSWVIFIFTLAWKIRDRIECRQFFIRKGQKRIAISSQPPRVMLYWFTITLQVTLGLPNRSVFLHLQYHINTVTSEWKTMKKLIVSAVCLVTSHFYSHIKLGSAESAWQRISQNSTEKDNNIVDISAII